MLCASEAEVVVIIVIVVDPGRGCQSNSWPTNALYFFEHQHSV